MVLFLSLGFFALGSASVTRLAVNVFFFLFFGVTGILARIAMLTLAAFSPGLKRPLSSPPAVGVARRH